MLSHEFMNATDFLTRNPTAFLQPDRIKPKLRHLVFTFDMNVGGLIPITRIEEEPIGTGPQNCRHECMLITRRILACRLS